MLLTQLQPVSKPLTPGMAYTAASRTSQRQQLLPASVERQRLMRSRLSTCSCSLLVFGPCARHTNLLQLLVPTVTLLPNGGTSIGEDLLHCLPACCACQTHSPPSLPQTRSPVRANRSTTQLNGKFHAIATGASARTCCTQRGLIRAKDRSG